MRGRHQLPAFRIAVVGAGAIGLYYGGKLAAFGRDVHLLLRSDYETIRKRGLRIRSKTENIHVPNVQGYRSSKEIGRCDLVLVGLTTTSNAQLPELIAPLLGEQSMILTLQNGLGNEDFLAAHFGAERILGGLCYVCLTRTESGIVERFEGGRIVIAEYAALPKPRTHDIAWEFKRCGVVCTVVADLVTARWRKLVWNIPFNGLTVTGGGLDTAALLANDALRLEVLALMNETIAIANTCGVNLPSALALEEVKRTQAMPPYKPSSLIDYEAGRSLEIEAIWGGPLRRAQAAGLTTPHLEKLYCELVALEAARLR